jgi:hypothetical protein
MGTLVNLLGSVASFQETTPAVPEPAEKSNLEKMAGFFKSSPAVSGFLTSADAAMKRHNIDDAATSFIKDKAGKAIGALGLFKGKEKTIYRFANKNSGKCLGWIYTYCWGSCNNKPGQFTCDTSNDHHKYEIIRNGATNQVYLKNVDQNQYINGRGSDFTLSSRKQAFFITTDDSGARFVQIRSMNGRCLRVNNASKDNKEDLQEITCNSNDPSVYWQLTRESGDTLNSLKNVKIG